MDRMAIVEAHDARIPAIGLGTAGLRGRACVGLVERALRIGYRHVDTAQFYGNESEVGEGVRASRLPRREVFVTTKIWWSHAAPRDLDQSVRESLAKLRLSEVDLLLLHWPNLTVPLADTIGALCLMRQLGLARHIGVSNFTIPLIEEAVKLSSDPLVTNQIEYHPYLNQTKVIGACRRHGIAVTAYCPIARGRVARDAVLVRIGGRHRKSPVQVALRWLVQQGVAAIPRTSKAERLEANLAIFDFELSAEEMTEIAALACHDGRLVNIPGSAPWD
jgi:diketogulonate reductase-like aldo/keto reductase